MSLCLLVSASVFAQSDVTVCQALKPFDPDRGFTVDFILDGTVKGNITVKGQRYRVAGGDALVFGDESAKYTYIPANNEVMIDAVDTSAVFSPVDIFSYSESASYQELGSHNIGGKMCRAVGVDRLEAVIYIFGGRVVALKFGQGADSHIIEVGVPGNTDLPDVNFNSANYPGVEIIDFR